MANVDVDKIKERFLKVQAQVESLSQSDIMKLERLYQKTKVKMPFEALKKFSKNPTDPGPFMTYIETPGFIDDVREFFRLTSPIFGAILIKLSYDKYQSEKKESRTGYLASVLKYTLVSIWASIALTSFESYYAASDLLDINSVATTAFNRAAENMRQYIKLIARMEVIELLKSFIVNSIETTILVLKWQFSIAARNKAYLVVFVINHMANVAITYYLLMWFIYGDEAKNKIEGK